MVAVGIVGVDSLVVGVLLSFMVLDECACNVGARAHEALVFGRELDVLGCPFLGAVLGDRCSGHGEAVRLGLMGLMRLNVDCVCI